MKAQSLHHIARMTKQSGGSYADNWPRTSSRGSVIIMYKYIVKAYLKELGNPGVLNIGSQKLDEAIQKAKFGDDLI